jgi:hypothetical protein
MDRLPEIFARQSRRVALIAESFRRLTGRSLLENGATDPDSLWTAPLAVVAHDTAADPVFFFGNRLVLALFEMTPAAFAALPSRLSAEPGSRAERAELLARVARDGFMTDYSGVRVSARGRRFRIHRATVWNLLDEEGRIQGQAAAFAEWTFLA